jgi:hypothetical protein
MNAYYITGIQVAVKPVLCVGDESQTYLKYAPHIRCWEATHRRILVWDGTSAGLESATAACWLLLLLGCDGIAGFFFLVATSLARQGWLSPFISCCSRASLRMYCSCSFPAMAWTMRGSKEHLASFGVDLRVRDRRSNSGPYHVLAQLCSRPMSNPPLEQRASIGGRS